MKTDSSSKRQLNKDLADVFLKLHYMEQSGKGISTIVDRYGRNVFNFSGSYIQCILPFNIVDKEKYYSMIGKKDFVNAPVNSSVNAPVNKTEQLIINLMNVNSLITYEELSKKIGKNRYTILRNIKTLKKKD